MKTIEEWAEQKGTADWQMAAAKHRAKWGAGRQVSEGDFDTAVAEAGGIKLSGYADQQRLTDEMKRQAEEAKAQQDAQKREADMSKTTEQQLAETTAKEG